MSATKQPRSKADAPLETEDAPPPQIRYPEHKGTPLRPGQFPNVEQLANLAAALARTLPGTPEQAEGLSDAALKLWRAARDTINEQKAQAASYWQKMDESQQMYGQAYDQVKARLEKLSATDYFSSESVSWLEAGKIFFPDAEDEARTGQLQDLVSEALAGKYWWKNMQPDDFLTDGFDHFAFITLVQYFDSRETEREAERTRTQNQERGENLTKARLAKQEAELKQQQEREMWKSPPIEDPS